MSADEEVLTLQSWLGDRLGETTLTEFHLKTAGPMLLAIRGLKGRNGSLRLDIGVLDHLGPFLDLGANVVGEL